jgi:hypothetical protein
MQNFPNPFNPTSRVDFDLPKGGSVTLAVYNIVGQDVLTVLSDEIVEAGHQSVIIDASSLPTGVYFYRLKISDPLSTVLIFQETKKMSVEK